MFEKTLSSKRIYKGRMIGMRDDKIRLATGKISHREICEHPGAVAIVAVTKKNEIVFIRQYRKPAEQVMIEIPAGLFNKGEDLKKAAARELKEETGYTARRIRHALSMYTSPGYSTEVLHFFFATGLKKGPQSTEDDEHIEMFLCPLKKAERMIKSGKIKDSKAIVGVYLALTHTLTPSLKKRGGIK